MYRQFILAGFVEEVMLKITYSKRTMNSASSENQNDKIMLRNEVTE